MQAIPENIELSSRAIAEAVVRAVIENLEHIPEESVERPPTSLHIRPEYLHEVMTGAPPGPGRASYILKDDTEVDLEKFGWEPRVANHPEYEPTSWDRPRFFRNKITYKHVFEAKVYAASGRKHFDIFKNQYRIYSGPLTVTMYLMLAYTFSIPIETLANER